MGLGAIREIVVIAADDVCRGVELHGDAGEGVADKAADGKLRLLAKRRADDDTAGKAVIGPRRERSMLTSSHGLGAFCTPPSDEP